MTDHKRLFELALEASSDGIWDWDITTGETYFSPQYFKMLGYRPDEFPHRLETWETLLHPEDREPVMAAIREHLERGESFNVKFRLKNASGEWQWILGRAKVMETDADGRPTRMVGTHVDIHPQTVLLERVNAQNSELLLLHRLGLEITSGGTIQSIVSSTLTTLRSTLENDLVLIFVVEGGQILSRWVSKDSCLFDDVHEKRWNMDECLCGLAASTGEPVFSDDVAGDERCVHKECVKVGIRSFAAIPLKADSKTIGVLGIGSVERVRYDRRKDFLMSVGSLISSGLRNAILTEELRKRNDDLRSRYQRRKQDVSRMLTAIENASLSIIITDVEGTIEYVNPFFSQLTGYSREEVIGKNPRTLNSGVHPPEFFRQMWETLLRQESWHGDICNRKRDGSLYWERAVISPFVDESESTVSYIAVKEDITKRKEREEELTILSNAVSESASSVVVTDARGRIVFVNASFTRLTGYTAEEAVGRTPRILKSGLHEDGFYRGLWETISAGGSWQGEILNRKKNGDRFWMSVTISPIQDGQGTITHYVGVQNDVTEKKELEVLKEEIDRVMRHDLKTPLNAIIGFPPLLEMDGNLTEDQLELTGAISKSARKMLRMIDCSLDLFKIETGRYDKPATRVDLVGILEEALVDLGPRMSAKRLAVRRTLNGAPLRDGAALHVAADAGLLHSLFFALLSNAFDASPAGGTVRVALDGDEGLRVTITNSGAVPPGIRKPFFQKYKSSGSKSAAGLGTYTAWKVAEAMGFELTMATSDEMNETTLVIRVPRDKCIDDLEA